MGKQWWCVFTLGYKEICAYTIDGTFAGELQATKELLAQENKVQVEEIKHKYIWR